MSGLENKGSSQSQPVSAPKSADCSPITPEARKAVVEAIIEDLMIQNPDASLMPAGELWLSGGVTPQSSGCLVNVEDLASSALRPVEAALQALEAEKAELVAQMNSNARAFVAEVDKAMKAEAALEVCEMQREDEAARATAAEAEVTRLRDVLGRTAALAQAGVDGFVTPEDVLTFTGRWAHLGSHAVKSILDEADAALSPQEGG